jgi:hypothetical protein
MYANVNLISHTKLVCENVVFSKPYYLENKCGDRKAFQLFLQSNRQFGYLEIEQMLPKNNSGLALF